MLGQGRSRKGIFEGDLEEGELEIGQVSALLKEIQPAKEIIDEIINEYLAIKATLANPD
jgi:enoyl-[acyl-carrier protein] reductase II